MLQINKLAIEVITKEETFSFKEVFHSGTNIISSTENTSGKSSIISAIVYALGMEEIIGIKGPKALSTAFNNVIKDNQDQSYSVIAGKIYLEISNGDEVVTIYRTTKDDDRNTNLVTVYYSNLESISQKETRQEDMYLHVAGAAVNAKGFFTFLEKFMKLALPYVPGSDGKDKKLYLQYLFSSFFIEQKRGWSDILARIPTFGVKTPRKRVIEYILNMESLENEKKSNKLNEQRTKIQKNWKAFYEELKALSDRNDFVLYGITQTPTLMKQEDIKVLSRENDESIEQLIEIKLMKIEENSKNKVKIRKNHEDMKKELDETLKVLFEHDQVQKNITQKISLIKYEIKELEKSIEFINTDISNNQDIKKLIGYGSSLKLKTFDKICPTCDQEINDSLLLNQNQSKIMTSEENVVHLKSQLKLFQTILKQKKKNLYDRKEDEKKLNEKRHALQHLVKIIRNDLFSLDGEYSQKDVYETIKLEEEIQNLEKFQIKFSEQTKQIERLSNEWENYLSNKESKNGKELSTNDLAKLKKLKKNFVTNLDLFGYKSANDFEKIGISEYTYLPEIMGYDMKFDSSASDHIRGIWAFTIALYETSNECDGNHPKLMIFDEPNQHSIIEKDMRAFFTKIFGLAGKPQIIIGYTSKDDTAIQILEDLEGEQVKIIDVGLRSLKKEIVNNED